MTETPAILTAKNVSKSYGAQPVLGDVSLSLHEGERVGLIGRNGCGKSTLLKVLAEIEKPDSGEVVRRSGLEVRMLLQSCALPTGMTVGDALREAGARMTELVHEHRNLAQQLAASDRPESESAEIRARFEELQHMLDLHGGWDADTDIKRVRESLQLPADDRTIGELSGGEQRRVDLACTLLNHPDVLLLDEPTNHIDTESARWIERFLRQYEGSCILVTHDRYFLDLVVTRIVELDRHRLFSFPGNYAEFLERKSALLDVEERTEANRQSALRRELEWLKRGPKARTTKQKARIKRFDELDAQQGPRAHREPVFKIPEPEPLGKRILDVDALTFGYGDETLIDHLSFIVQKGMRIGIVGPNGSGKTTLIKLLLGEIEAYKGRITVGDRTSFLYVDQLYEDIDPNLTVLDYVTGGGHYAEVNGKRIYVPSYLENMLFDMDTVQSPMHHLSGGERNRVVLAKKLLRGGNFLVLDEPTNDLDLATLRVLEEAIEHFSGCSILISHDRYFLNRLATHMIAFDGRGGTEFLVGNYDDYARHMAERAAAQKPARRTGADNARPRRRTSHPERLTYKEQQELETMEKTIEDAEADLETLERKTQEPGFFEQDHAEVRDVLQALEIRRQEVENLYARWETLDARKDIK